MTVRLRAGAFLRAAGRLRAGAFRFATFLRAGDFRFATFLRAGAFRFATFLRVVAFRFTAFFAAGLTMPPFVNAVLLGVAPAYEGPVSFDDAFRAGAAGLQSLRSCSGAPLVKSSLRT